MSNRLRVKKNAKGEISYYFADFYCGRQGRKKVSLKTRDETAARLKFTEYERKFMAGLWNPWTDPVDEEGVTVAEAVERFLKDRERTSSAGTAAFYGHILNPFLLHLKQPNLPLYSLKPDRVEKYLRGLQVAESTRRNYTNRFRMFFHWCRKEGLLKEDVAPKPVGGKRGRQKALPKFMTEEQFEQLIRAVEADAVLNANIKGGNRYLIDVFRFTVNSGLRLGEVCNLRWSAIDFASGVFTVANTEEFTTKSGRERSVPLVGAARQTLARLMEERATESDGYVFKGERGRKLYGRYVSKRFRKYRDLARLPKELHFHSLRHTFASWFVQRGGDLYQLKEILGHADIKMTQVYAHLKPDGLMQAMERTFGAGTSATADVQAELERLRAELSQKNAILEQLRVSLS